MPKKHMFYVQKMAARRNRLTDKNFEREVFVKKNYNYTLVKSLILLKCNTCYDYG